MRSRGPGRRRAVDRGFVVSDHVDWPDLLRAIDATGASTIWVTHGSVAVVVRYLRDRGFEAEGLATRFSDEEEAATEANE
jgi:putative mRNA 3-end processing factor